MGKTEMVLSKMFSGRYFVIICFTLTLCYLVHVEPTCRDAFFALAGGAIRDYFSIKKEDSAKPEVKPNA